jgi:Fe-S oxidoreductase
LPLTKEEKVALEDYRQEMETCCRCSACKFIPLEKVTGYDNVNVCPSISRFNFHAYSGGGRLGVGVAILEKELDYSEKMLELIYNCQMCGACDVSCKYAMDMDILEPLYAMRIDCVGKGHTLPALDRIINNLRERGTMVTGVNPKKDSWSDGLNVADYSRKKVDVIYHAGCRTRLDREMWNAARANVTLMQKTGVNVGIASQEICCGGRAYEMGYRDDFLKQAKALITLIKASGATTLVTGCAECYHAFKVLYAKFGLIDNIEVYHTSEYFSRLIREGKLEPVKKLDIKVTYHDPCHLGRLGEPYVKWQGKQLPGHIRVFDPPRTFRRGTLGVYEPPRHVLGSLPGTLLMEMDRTREYAWCCGSGGGVAESNPEFAEWTANERVREAMTTGADAIVTTCPGCISSFRKAVKDTGSHLTVYDLTELLSEAVR